MIIFLYGQDTYRSRQKLNEIIEHYKKGHKSPLDLRYLEGKDLEFQKFEEELCSQSMFKEKKLIVARDIFSNENFKENFLKTHHKFINSKNIIIFYEGKEIPPGDPLFKFFKKNARIQEFTDLEGQRLKNWVKKKFESYQVDIDLGALNKLIDFIGNDLWRMENEIKKLVSYKKGKEIGTRDIETLVRSKIDTAIFETVDAIASGNKKRALELLHKHLEKGDSPFYLLAMINFQFRNIIEIKDLVEKNSCREQESFLLRGEFYSAVLRKTRLHPFVVKKSYDLARKFTLEKLKKIYRKIFQADFNIKTGEVETETALDLLIAEI